MWKLNPLSFTFFFVKMPNRHKFRVWKHLALKSHSETVLSVQEVMLPLKVLSQGANRWAFPGYTMVSDWLHVGDVVLYSSPGYCNFYSNLLYKLQLFTVIWNAGIYCILIQLWYKHWKRTKYSMISLLNWLLIDNYWQKSFIYCCSVESIEPPLEIGAVI